MKLLSPSEAASQAKKSLESEKYRLVEVQTLITDKYKELSRAEQDFANVLANQQDVWSASLEEFEVERNKLKREVEELEERRKQALIPLTEREKMLDTKASALVMWEERLTKKEDDVEDRIDLLTVKLDEVAERELQADTMAKSLSNREQGIQLQAGQVAHDQALLATASAELSKRVNEAEHAITLKWAEVNAKEANLVERERIVAEKEAGFGAKQRALEDGYATLERSIKRLNNGTGTPRPK